MNAEGVYINESSALAIDVGCNSSMTVDETIDNGGTVCILAGAGAAAGKQYSPITAGNWDGTGTYQAVGGVWNADHTFTVSEASEGTSGEEVEIDLASTQRVLIGLPASTGSVGASFLAKTGTPPAPLLSFTATAINGTPLDALELLAGSGQSVLGAWQFAASGGYSAGEPAYLSFDIGAGFSRDTVQIWHYDTAGWTPFAATDLSYDGQYANFTVTGFSGYAVTTVPEPGALAPLPAVVMGLLVFARRKRQGCVRP